MMDKYTVDLDQLLNDFEYSELTEQQSRSSTQIQTPPPPPSVTKYSMNNVFTSLNEYLNSDINPATNTQFVDEPSALNDNNVEYNFDLVQKTGEYKIIPRVGHSILDVTPSEVSIHDPEPISLIDSDNPVCFVENIIDVESEDFSQTEKVFEENMGNERLEADMKNIILENVLVNIGSDTLESFVIEPAGSKEFAGESGAEAEKQFETTEIDEPEAVIQNHLEEQNQILDELNELDDSIKNSAYKKEDSAVNPIKNTEQQEEPINDEKEIIHEEKESVNDVQETLNEENDTINEESSVCNGNEISNESVEKPNEEEPIVDQFVTENNESCKPIGFSTEIDIDENELKKMLEDLEIEEHTQVVQTNEEIDDKLVEENQIELECSGVEANEQDNKSTDVNQPINPESEVEQNPQNDPIEATISHPQIIECLEIEKPVVKKSKSNVKTIEPETVEASEEKESLNRPQELPLNNERREESTTRKINLIGSPGSTPYNNVYVNKTIDAKSHHDHDSDCTSSASPTFSDCSTENTSTASTVSVEDLPNLKNKNGDRGENANENGDAVANNEVVDVNTENIDNLENATGDSQVYNSQSTDTFLADKAWLGKEAPLWIPDADAAACLHCDMKFTVIKRRHHCRACGLVLCSKCCNLKFRLEYLDAEARVCTKCYNILNRNAANSPHNSPEPETSPTFRPNPNNPLEYCSTVSPLQQAGQTGAPPSVMVPVGVLKRQGSNKKSNKSVMFCDGIAPGSDLTILDQDFNYNSVIEDKKVEEIEEETEKEKKVEVAKPAVKVSRHQPKSDTDTGCFIPKSETSLPPTVCVNKTDVTYSDCSNSPSVVEMLKNEALVFAITQNLFVHVKVINMSCCINKHAWCFCTEGLINVGSDEVIYLIEYIEEESFVPKDVFFHIHNVYLDAVKGTAIKELGLSLHNTSNFLDSRNHAGFVYIKPTFQCLEHVIVPKEPFLIGILIHRWETPWAKLFPLRLILRLGAEYRYYPSPLISSRHRDSVFVEIGHTIINLLADFRNFTYTLPQIRGLIIHMEDKKTTISIPRNRYEQVMKSINNSSEHILAFAGNFSPEADSHLVCIQDTQSDENVYTTHAINIHNKPRKITGASFIVFNGSLKSSSGLTAKSNIVEDGLMIQIPSEHMDKIRDTLRNMKNHTISCGCVNATTDETVNVVWGDNDVEFNVGIKSPVDLKDMKGVPSIRVHNSKDHFCNNGSRLIRWTEVFILQNSDENSKNQDPVDISKISESIAKACCAALVKYLDLLVSNSFQKIGIRTTLHVENVSYSAGSNGLKLPPIYMRSLDNELVPILHRITSNNLGDNVIELELIFRILNA